MVSACNKEQELRQIFTQHGQEHVFRYWDELHSTEQAQLLNQLSELVASGCLTLGEIAGESIAMEPLREGDVTSRVDPAWSELGREAIEQGRVAVVTLAGGQGTRLGSSQPKGCFDLGLPSGSTPFRLQAERIRKLGRLLPWLIMTSPATHAATEAYFQANRYFGLDPTIVRFFQQGSLAAFNPQGRMLMEGKGRVSMAPDGNGGVFAALQRHGLLAWLGERGVELLNIVGIDNVLVLPADPIMMGWALSRQLDCASKSLLRSDPRESVGLFMRASQGGAIGVAEYSELSEAERAAPNAQANLANHVVSLEFCRRVAALSLPRHRAHKQIPALDAHGQASKQAGIKLETFIFDAFLQATAPGLLQVERAEQFAPVKNATGEADTPATARAALDRLHRSWIGAAGGRVEGEGIFEISPLVSYAGEALDFAKGRTFNAPMHLG